jgi:4-amino-4-deoxy-L-arabinose transferase-like glycosyltransferase
VDETEPLFAEASRQMLVRDNWLTPYFNGDTRFDKPPLIYWLTAIAYQRVGVNAWGARLPSALSALGLALFLLITVRQFGVSRPVDPDGVSAVTDRQRWLATGIATSAFILSPQSIVWARTGVSDMLLVGCMGIALLAFFWGYVQPTGSRTKLIWYLVFYGFCALAVLAKGPIGVGLPGLVVLAFLIYLGNWRVLGEMHLLKGVGLFLAIAVPWYVLIIQVHGQDYIENFFGYHNVERFTRAVNNHSAPWYFYIPVVLIGFAPWSLHLPVAIAHLRVWRPGEWRRQPRSNQLEIFAFLWVAVVFGFFTLAMTKLPSYMLPLIPPSAILVGSLWSKQMVRRRSSVGVRWSSWLSVGFALLVAGGLVYSPAWMGDDPAMPLLPQVMRQSGVLVAGAIVWLGLAIVNSLLLLRQQGRWLWLTTVIALVLFISSTAMPAVQIVDAQRQLPLRQLAATVVAVQQPGEEVVMVGFEKPSLVFYTQGAVYFKTDPRRALRYLKQQRLTHW